MNPELRALKSLQSWSPNKQEPGIKEDCLSQLHRLCHSLCLGRESQIKAPSKIPSIDSSRRDGYKVS